MLAVLKAVQLTTHNTQMNDREVTFRMQKMCSLYFRERGISDPVLKELADQVPSSDKGFQKFLQKDFLCIAKAYSKSTLVEADQQYYMKRWIPFSSSQPHNYFEKIVNRRNLCGIASNVLKSVITATSNILFPALAAVELLSTCSSLREWIFSDAKHGRIRDTQVTSTHEVENKLSELMTKEDEQIAADKDLED